MSVCLDAFALLAWLEDEPGADLVEGFLRRAADGDDFRCFVSPISLGEVYVALCRSRGPEEAEAFWEDVHTGAVPVTAVELNRRRVLLAARLRVRHLIAQADAFALQLAQEMQASLVTGDPEIRALEGQGLLRIVWLLES